MREQQQREREQREQADAARQAHLEAERQLREQQQAADSARNTLNQSETGLTEQRERDRQAHVNVIIEATNMAYEEIVSHTPSITSEFRPNSAAHIRGAVDFSTKKPDSDTHYNSETLHNLAKETSANLGAGYIAIVEEVNSDATQVNTTYHNGVLGRRRHGPQRATATHLHVQALKKTSNKSSLESSQGNLLVNEDDKSLNTVSEGDTGICRIFGITSYGEFSDTTELQCYRIAEQHNADYLWDPVDKL